MCYNITEDIITYLTNLIVCSFFCEILPNKNGLLNEHNWKCVCWHKNMTFLLQITAVPLLCNGQNR